MKPAALGFLTLVPLVAKAAEITLISVGSQDSDLTDSIGDHVGRTATEGFAVPIGTSGAETTYVLNYIQPETITTTVNGVAATSLSTFLSSGTIVASASGFKGNDIEGWDTIDCRYTGDKLGECVYVAVNDGRTRSDTRIGTPIAVVVPVSERSEGASPTGNNGATAITAAKMLA
ncbi:hypothetical protein PQX77_005816, partial [Marasmius sp. AFHP31]